MGMAHRGRLSVIAEFLKKPFKIMFAEFSENYMPNTAAGVGDVKYHLGYVATRKLEGGREVMIRLSSNPSHLEAVNPVVEGIARARQRIRKDTEQRAKVLPLLIHGDAAFAGQGIVARTLNMSQLAATTPAASCRRGQQPDWLHHASRRCALDDVLHRRGEDDRGRRSCT
jgi:2-oxoglutarate dehydrogenase E1 component